MNDVLATGLKKKTRQKGSALVLVLIIAVILATVAAGVMYNANQETRQTHRARLNTNSLEGAKASLAATSNNILHMAKTRPPSQFEGEISRLNEVINSIEPTLPKGMRWVTNDSGIELGYTLNRGPNDFEYREIEDPDDPWYGYSTAKLDWEVVSFLVEDVEIADMLGYNGNGVRRRITVDYIPLYQYAIFYDNELELHPGPTMDVRGRMHSNVDMYLTCSKNIYFHEKVTCAGGIYRMMNHEGGGGPRYGKVNFKVPTTGTSYVWKNMTSPPSPSNGDAWLDHRDESWTEGALNRWEKQVLDSAHGVNSVQPPLPAGAAMYDMLARVDDENDAPEIKAIKMEYQANLIITGDPGDSSTISLYSQEILSDEERALYKFSATDTNKIVSRGLFYDGHQQTVIRTLDIDINQLRLLSSYDWSNSDGIVYVTTTPNLLFDEYTLSAGNLDPNIELDANGKPKFNRDTGAPIADPIGWMAAGKSNYMPAVRLINASQFPKNDDNGFALYTDRPLYTCGDINTSNKCTTVIGADSITITAYKHWLAELDLANAFSRDRSPDGKPDTRADRKQTILNYRDRKFPDESSTSYSANRGFTRDMGNSYQSSKYTWDRSSWWVDAKSTTTNAIFLMGNTPSLYKTNNDEDETWRDLYSGGAHNVMRYLEDWGGKTHTLNGSMIVLFGSPVASHTFRCCDSKGYYSPPTRNYNWDNSLKTSEPPPGMPVFVDVRVYEMEPITYDDAISTLLE